MSYEDALNDLPIAQLQKVVLSPVQSYAVLHHTETNLSTHPTSNIDGIKNFEAKKLFWIRDMLSLLVLR